MERIAVTNRHLCEGDFLTRIRELAKDKNYDAILLREKDLTPQEYFVLAKSVLSICEEQGKKCVLHYFPEVAKQLQCKRIHLPLQNLRGLSGEEKAFFQEIGTSVHSLEQAREAVSLGAGYVFAGHIFATDCKKNLPPRGLSFLREIVREIPIPVYGIGGIDAKNESLVADCKVRGVCLMSGCMRASR